MENADFIYLGRFTDGGIETAVLEHDQMLIDYLAHGWQIITREMYMDIWRARDAAELKRLRTEALTNYVRALQKEAQHARRD